MENRVARCVRWGSIEWLLQRGGRGVMGAVVDDAGCGAWGKDKEGVSE